MILEMSNIFIMVKVILKMFLGKCGVILKMFGL